MSQKNWSLFCYIANWGETHSIITGFAVSPMIKGMSFDMSQCSKIKAKTFTKLLPYESMELSFCHSPFPPNMISPLPLFVDQNSLMRYCQFAWISFAWNSEVLHHHKKQRLPVTQKANTHTHARTHARTHKHTQEPPKAMEFPAPQEVKLCM